MNWPQQITRESLLDLWNDDSDCWVLDEGKHWIQHASEEVRYRLPLVWPQAVRGESIEEYTGRIPEENPSFLIIMVQLGAAAIGFVDEGEFLAHKAIKKYMKRQKRGKAQIQYLNTRGKSKAGSRVRLANTERFFEEINERLTDWGEMYDEPDYIFISCTPNVWGLMYAADPAPPFDRKDHRIRKIPYDVPIPDFEQLQIIASRLTMAVRI